MTNKNPLNNEKIAELKKLLENGTPFEHAKSNIGVGKDDLTIEDLGGIQVRSNTVGGCPIGMQYCGCENWK